MNMIVVDEAHEEAGKVLQKLCDEINEAIDDYIIILGEVTSEAAKAGHTTERYNEYKSIISGLRGDFTTMGNLLKTSASAFVSAIDSADKYLY